MNFNEYQETSMKTQGDLNNIEKYMCGAMGISGEAGEVTDLVKKYVFHHHDLDINKLKKELGDVMWYIALLCDSSGISMEDVAIANIEKLKERYPEGFDVERSKNRD